jgi:hypothetical protein
VLALLSTCGNGSRLVSSLPVPRSELISIFNSSMVVCREEEASWVEDVFVASPLENVLHLTRALTTWAWLLDPSVWIAMIIR